jgi:hypothetical protein
LYEGGKKMTWRWLASGALAAVVVGCGVMGGSTSSGPPPNNTPAVDALVNPAHPGIEACRTGDVEGTLQLAKDFKDSCHEMIVCGGLATSLSGALVNILLETALGQSGGGGGFAFDGKGTWVIGALKADDPASTGSRMEVTFHLGGDTSFGKKGDLITFDLLRIDTYLKGAKIQASGSIDTTGKTAYSLTVAYDEPGPGFELLGLGGASSGIQVSADAVAAALGKIEISSKVKVKDKHKDSVVTYDLVGPRTPLGEVTKGGGNMPLTLENVSAVRGQQALAITKWDIRYQNTSKGILDGTIGFDVTGGAFAYSSVFTYPRRMDPDVTLACK